MNGGKTEEISSNHDHVRHWKKFASKLKHLTDPWEAFHIDEIFPDEIGIRHRYNAVKRSWVCDEVHVRMEKEPFDRGAMRECFRMKKLSNFTKTRNWKHAGNHVAKRYINEVDRKTYFDDVVLQMDAKLWGEEYNRHSPPKKVDILQISVLEMKNRKDSPLYHIEHFIEGKYIKYNSNSGFIHSDDTLRATPQAFSHFTFERSNHKIMVVDIQGVGDLYTDPQIHSTSDVDYGEANLGTRGMALFFSSHRCNRICESLGLSRFDLSESEMKRLEDQDRRLMNSLTIKKDIACLSISIPEEPIISPPSTPATPNACYSPSSASSLESSDDYFGNGEINCKIKYEDTISVVPRSSSVSVEKLEMSKLIGKCAQSVLGEIHYILAEFNEVGRFTNQEIQVDSALFHLEQSAHCFYPKALITLAKIYLQLPHDNLSSLTIEESEENRSRGVECMENACDSGNIEAMVYMAHAWDTGIGLVNGRSKSWSKALCLYENLIEILENDTNIQQSLFDPLSKLCSRVAEMYREGGDGIERDLRKAGDMYNRAGEHAMTEMKGKLANKYFILSEEIISQLEDVE